MRCFLRQIGTNWHAAFDFNGQSFTHSLRTKSESEAEVRIGAIRDTLYRLELGTLTIPDGADAKAFILAGGKVVERAGAEQPPFTVADLADSYIASRKGNEANTLQTMQIHFNHVKRHLRAGTRLDAIDLPMIDAYVSGRLADGVQSLTIRKELQTLRQAWNWAVERGRLTATPPWTARTLEMPKDRGRERFRGFDEITGILKRGGVEEPSLLWECLYLTGDELQSLLDHVAGHAKLPWITPMVTFVALTGCRRSEMMRSRLDDWDFKAGRVAIREKKRDTSREYTTRDVDLHPRLREVMADWFKEHPGGQYAITSGEGPISVVQAGRGLRRTLAEHEKWSKVPGFHTLRHSVASILASKGVDQRYIDKILGHHTEAMRRRYQHLLPKGIAAAINSLLG